MMVVWRSCLTFTPGRGGCWLIGNVRRANPRCGGHALIEIGILRVYDLIFLRYRLRGISIGWAVAYTNTSICIGNLAA
jgi:hypothetical protein